MNPLLDYDFLNKLMNYRQREIYAKVTLLTKDELPIESIEGRITGGSINVDGNSALRRTCNLTMVLWDQNEINSFYWTFKTKFKLEIGIKNNINSKYSDIIWFPQGVFILTTCNMNQTTNNYTITINGKDKMCLLNGDLGGSLPHSTDFAVEEYLDTVTGEITYNKILLKNIIRNAVQTFGGELPSNIIINDLDEAGLELLEYRQEELPLYLFRNIEDGQVDQVTINGEHPIYLPNSSDPTPISAGRKANEQNDSALYIYADTSNLINPEVRGTLIKMDPNADATYQIIKFDYGDLAGYRLTDLTFAGELKANVGETLVSVLDKIKNMLGNFEYFYNLDGKFVFQKKRTYVAVPWTASETNPEDVVNAAINDAYPKINLSNAELVTTFANNPNLLNVRNDFAVWGTYKSISGADIPIHMRYALDTKPTHYNTIRSIWTRRADTTDEPPLEYVFYRDHGYLKEDESYMENGVHMKKTYLNRGFTTDAAEQNHLIYVDWRELIYQMALDYFQCGSEDYFTVQVANANPNTYPTGITGYEPYYTDMQGFWRQLYNPYPDATYEELAAERVHMSNKTVYVKDYYRPVTWEEIYSNVDDILREDKVFPIEDLYVIRTIETTSANGTKKTKSVFYPFIGSQYCCLVNHANSKYYYYNGSKWIETDGTNDTVLNVKPLNTLYVDIGDDKKDLLVEQAFKNFVKNYPSSSDTTSPVFWIKETGRKKLQDLDERCKTIYRGGITTNQEYVQYLYNWAVEDNYGTLSDSKETTDRVTYLEESYSNEFDPETYWNYMVYSDPGALLFWFDFLETEGSDLYKYSVKEIGPRTKSINDTNVKSIYYRDVPNVIFMQDLSDSTYERQPGYTYIQLPPGYQSLFSVSGRGKSAKERLDELLQEHSYCAEATNITTIPLYHLEPNTRVRVEDAMSKVDGEYIVTKVTIPLAYSGTMSLSTTKVVSNIA